MAPDYRKLEQMYKIIGHPNSRASRVAWMLEELGQDYEYNVATPQSETARKYNPNGKVPILLDGDNAIIDSVAIVTYLADKHSALTHKAGTIERAQQDSLMQFACDELDGPLWTGTKHRFALPKEHRIEAMKDTARYEFEKGCKALGIRLGDNEFVTGDTFTIADLIIGHCAGWAKGAKFDWPDGTVGDYFQRLQSRDALARARAKGEAAVDS